MSGHGGNGTAAGEQGSGIARTRAGRRLLRNLLLLTGLAVLFTVPTKAFVAQAFLVPTGSMADTLRPGDRVLVSRLVSGLGGIHRRYHPDDPASGTVPENAVVGRAIVVFWPPSELGSLPVPATFSRPSLSRQGPVPPHRPGGAPAIPRAAGAAR